MTSFTDAMPAEGHRFSIKAGEEKIKQMPVAFLNIEDVRCLWRLMLSRANNFIREIFKLRQRQSTPLGSLETAVLGPPIDSTTLSDSIKTFQCEKEKYVQEHKRWRLAFKPLYKKITASSDKSAVVSAHTLYIRCKTSEMNLVSALDTDNCSFDDYLADFREIVSTCQKIIQMKKSALDDDFTFNLGVIPALHVVRKWCRDQVVRQEAIAL